MNQRFIYLASASPRRRALLDQVGVRFRTCPVPIDESWRNGELPGDYVSRMAREKADVAAQSIDNTEVILAADTSVVIDGVVLGKPRDREDGMAMLTRLSASEHEVLTAVCVRQGDRVISDLSATRVVFRSLGQNEMDAYWATGEAVDKAGGYSIQGLAAVFIERIEGSYSGVMGLPLFETVRLLQQCGVDILSQDS